MYELERLVQGVPFEVFVQLGDSVWIGPAFASGCGRAPVPEGVVCLIDKGAVEFWAPITPAA